MNRYLVLLLVCLAGSIGASALASTASISGYIGCHRKTFKVQSITGSAAFTVKGRPDYLAVTEVFADTPRRTYSRYRITAAGIGTFDRSGVSTGFGPATFFVKLRGAPLGRVTITNLAPDRATRPVLIQSVWGVSKAQLDAMLSKDHFTLSGLLPYTSPQERDRLAGLFVSSVKQQPRDHIDTALSAEIPCGSQDAPAVIANITRCAELATRHKTKLMLGLVTWWGGTPAFVSDGSGGRFGDVKYQQVCYSPDHASSENADLAKLLGDRYNTHYCLTIPNQWSSTPWLTMNSPALNEYRHRRFRETIEALKDADGVKDWLAGLFVDNEPRYWDTMCVAGDPNSRGRTLWADFNPLTVADAAKDGVKLDPADGLSDAELAWLHRNVSRYNQASVDACSAALAEAGLKVPLYTHSLQMSDMFPGAAIGHSAAEWAYAERCRSGIESMYSMPSDYTGLRELGRWGDVDREENDGHDTDWHLWDLRVAYMMGADMYNSYNWHAIGPERVFAYMNEFLRDLPVVSLPAAEVRAVDQSSLRLKAPMKMQAFSRLDIPLRAPKKTRVTAFLGLVTKDGRTCSSERRSLTLQPGTQSVGFGFSSPAECKWGDEALVVLYVSDQSGKFSPSLAAIDASAPQRLRLSLDLRTQRALSLAVIAGLKNSR